MNEEKAIWLIKLPPISHQSWGHISICSPKSPIAPKRACWEKHSHVGFNFGVSSQDVHWKQNTVCSIHSEFLLFEFLLSYEKMLDVDVENTNVGNDHLEAADTLYVQKSLQRSWTYTDCAFSSSERHTLTSLRGHEEDQFSTFKQSST